LLPGGGEDMKKVLSAEDWQEIGTQTKQAREELFKLFRLSAGHMPKDTMNLLNKAIDSLDKYRNKAENRMIQTGATNDLTIFYGEQDNTINL
jgi:hypothetical protein